MTLAVILAAVFEGIRPISEASPVPHPLVVAACKEGLGSGVEAALKEDPSVDADTLGEAYVCAARRGDISMARTLESAGADILYVTRKRSTALIEASRNGHLSMVEDYIKRGADVHYLDRQGRDALLHACNHRRNDEVVMALIAAGADVSRSDRLGNTNLYFAACEGSPSIVRMLFEAGGDDLDVDAVNKDGTTPLICAAQNGHGYTAKTLLDRGANADVSDRTCETALGYAVRGSHTDVVRDLLSHGADLKGCILNPPLHQAVFRSDYDMIGLLLKLGADPETPNHEGTTPLMIAVYIAEMDVVDQLVRAGANVTAVDNNGNQALHYSVAGGHEEAYDRLISLGAVRPPAQYWTLGTLPEWAIERFKDGLHSLADFTTDSNL